MSRRYSHLLSPLRIGNSVVLKNRTLYPNASPHFLQGPENYPAEGYISFVSGLAKNGAAVITLAEWDNPGQRLGPADVDFTHMQSFDLTNPAVHNYFSAMADEVHFYGSKLLISADIAMPRGYTLNGDRAFGPPSGDDPDEWKPLPVEMMPEVIETFIKKLRTYKIMGYDGVTMRGERFLYPNAGKRNDAYDGSIENRTRFVRQVYHRVKEVFGPDFITEIQIAGEQPHGYDGELVMGYTLEEAIEFLRLAQDDIDIVQLRESDVTRSHPTGFTFKKGEHGTIGYSMAIKAAGINIITEPIGGFQDPEELDAYIAEGKCDMFGMSRAFMCDFEYGKKLYEGRGEDITPCLWCNKCHGTILQEPDPWISVCSVNPLMGIQHKLGRMISPAEASRKVAVIGGGPSGMRAAITAAERGHKVTLYERSGQLGGQLIHGDYFSFKWPVGQFKNWLIRRVEQLGVDVRLNCQPTAADIEALAYDAVIAATGVDANTPNIPGLHDENGLPKYMTCLDLWGREAELGKRVVIIGGSETGVETAMHLCELGHDVTVLTRQEEIGHDCSKLHYITMAFVKMNPDTNTGALAAAWEKYDNLTGIPGVTTTSVTDRKVMYTDAEGKAHELETDSIIVCGGMTPRLDDALSYADSAQLFFVVGDAAGAGNIQKCMRDAYSKACMI